MDIANISDEFNRSSEKYDSQRRCLIPCFDDFYGVAPSLLFELRKSFERILDLGAGTGLLSQVLLRRYPAASFTLVDVAGEMLAVARERFSGMTNVSYQVGDYAKALPDGRFDLIASALSIHHLDDPAKERLYASVYERLASGGVLLNLDQFNAGSAAMNELYVKWWHAFIDASGMPEADRAAAYERRKLDRENTVDETKALLRRIGFSSVECVYSHLKFGAILAIKPG